jgi:hypothetical protein
MRAMSHAHHWRATSKVFALVCECGTTYHEWLLAEIDRLKATAAPTQPAEEVLALRAQLEELRRESAGLREQLEEARRELEAQAAKVTSQVSA